MAKFDRLPPGVADALKKNATFVEEEGPMREAVLAASPLTKQELLRDSPGAEEIAMKVGCGGRERLLYVHEEDSLAKYFPSLLGRKKSRTLGVQVGVEAHM